MIRLLEFINIYNNLNNTKKFKATVRYTKHTENVLKFLIKINIISWYTVSNLKKKKIIIFKVSKHKKIVPLWKGQQKLKLKAAEINKLNNLSKQFIIISTSTGLKLINPYIPVKEGGLIIAKIQL